MQLKLFSLETLLQVTYDLHKSGKRICLTHGAFYLFHYSHLDLLEKSSSNCDFLIVSIESDQSVAEYKSYRRPIIDEHSRLRIIGSLECVDAVFMKDIPLESNARIELYKAFPVDLFSIGKNYNIAEEIEYDTQKAHVTLMQIETEQIYTTTSIIQSIIGKYTTKEKPVRKEV